MTPNYQKELTLFKKEFLFNEIKKCPVAKEYKLLVEEKTILYQNIKMHNVTDKLLSVKSIQLQKGY